MRLIDADELKKAFEEDGHLSPYIEEFIDDVPTIEPVKYGKWVDKTVWIRGIGHYKYECSCCGYVVNHKPKSRGDGKGGKYCDECGAKMECE